MVVADERVWDDYLKVRRDARKYKTKIVPYYKELCLIFGGVPVVELGDDFGFLPNTDESGSMETACEEEEEDLREVTIDEDCRLSGSRGTVEVDQNNISPDEIGCNCGRMRWQPLMDRYFIDLMLEELRKGNQIDGMFGRRAWKHMVMSFNAEFGYDYDIDFLKNRYKTLKKQQNAIRNILDQDGFAWDDIRQMIIADDSVWQDYIKKHTGAHQFMNRPVPYYKDLCSICGDDNPDLSKSVDIKVQGESRSYPSPGPSGCSDNDVDVGLGSAGSLAKIVRSEQTNKQKLENKSNSAFAKRPWSKEMNSYQQKVATGVVSLSHKMEESTNSTSIENIVKEIQALPNMDDDLVLDSCDFLEDETRARTFMALDYKLRKKWLLRKLRQNN